MKPCNTFFAKYGDKINYHEENNQLSVKPTYDNNKLKTGYVAAIEGDRFLVTGRKSSEENSKKQLHGMWFPIHDVKD